MLAVFRDRSLLTKATLAMSTTTFTRRFTCDFLLSSRCRAADKSNHSNLNVARIIAPRSYHFVIAVWRAKAAESRRVKYWE